MKFSSVTKLGVTAAGAAVGFVAGGPVGAAAGAGLGGAIDLWRHRKDKHRPTPEHVKAAIRAASPAQAAAQLEATKLEAVKVETAKLEAKIEAAQKGAPLITIKKHAPPFFPGMPEKMMPLIPVVDQAAIDYVRKSGLTFEQVYPHGIEALRGIAPPLVIIGDSGGYTLNVEAINFVVSTGLAFKDIYPTVPALPSTSALPPVLAAMAGPSMRQAQQSIDALYAMMARFPRGALGPYIDGVRKKAPPFVITSGPQGSPPLRTVNIMAPAYARSIGLPITLVYPNAYQDANALAPELVKHVREAWGDNQEINPDAILFAMTTGFQFAELYPTPPPWNSGWPGSKDTAMAYAKLVGKPFDGPGGVYVNWHHESGGFNVGDFASNVVNTCGAVAGAGLRAVNDASGAIGGALGKIPVVGGPLEAAWDYTTTVIVPLHLAADIASGKAIDQAVMGSFKSAMKDIHTLAPYIETVIASVPALGPVASAAIAGGLALASGEPIDQVMVDAGAAAIPGGAIVKACYHAGVAVMNGHGDAGTLIVDAGAAIADSAGVPVPDSAKKVLEAGADATFAIANGKKPDQALLDAAVKQLPPEGQAAAKAAMAVASGKNVGDVLLKYGPDMIKGLPTDALKNFGPGLSTGMAMGHGQALQAIQDSAITKSIGHLATAGAQVASSSPLFSKARELNDTASMYGFDVGAAMTKHVVTRFQVEATRRILNPAQQKGYDMALGLHVSQVVYKPPSKLKDPMEIAGYMIAHGLRNAKTTQKKAVLDTVVLNPKAAKGVKLSAQVIAKAQHKTDWLHWAGAAFGVVVGGVVAGPVGIAAGGALGGAIDAFRHRHKQPAVSHGVPASHVAALTGKQ